jgi:hypothetical protein
MQSLYWCLTEFIDWIQSLMLVFSAQPCELLPLKPSLWFTSSTPPSLPKVKVQIVCGWEGVGVLSYVGDHILQKFNTLFLTRFRNYKIALPSQDKNRGGKGFQTDNTCRKVPLQVNFSR